MSVFIGEKMTRGSPTLITRMCPCYGLYKWTVTWLSTSSGKVDDNFLVFNGLVFPGSRKFIDFVLQ